jgi:endonuclease YncB( thermonuclease family)
VYVDDVFVNKQLLEQGYATTLTIWPNTQFASAFATIEVNAQAAGVGLWSTCADQSDS